MPREWTRIGRHMHEWVAVSDTEVGAVPEMARCLRCDQQWEGSEMNLRLR
jgi:hypothetical protein